VPYDQPQPPVQRPGRATAAEESAAALLDDLDRRLRGRAATFIGGQSPWAATEAWGDWAFHLAVSPGRRLELAMHAMRATAKLWASALHGGARPWAFEPLPADRRFRADAWNRFPFNLMAQAQLALESQWRLATGDLRGVSQHHLRRVAFLGDLVLNAIAPINGVLTNPEVLDAAVDTGGRNFVKGAELFAQDFARLAAGGRLTGLESFKVGRTMAMTPGEVVFRNDLMEVIQYAPTTAKVQAEPILIVPAWIMKYYILDLTPETSLVRHLVDQGFTVFMISWRNPRGEAHDVSFEDYRIEGVEKAIEVVARIAAGEKIQAVGYCLGGTTLAITAAALGRDKRDGLATLSLLAAQTDFDDAGELLLFIDESQLSLLEDMMLTQGYLEARQMSGAFYALRSNDMLWSQLVDRYLIAKPKPLGPLDAWLADATRMPARMHGEYLRGLFLENSFAHGRYETPGGAVAMKDITTPVFALGAERDHIAPWRSVYKIELYGSTDTTFVLTGGGHNTSVVSPPGKAGAYYWVRETEQGQPYAEPDVWWASATKETGSWWPCWTAWLKARSRGELVDPPAMGGGFLKPLGPAPGAYVFET
jgi:polyhydroxyalkanoate synthase